MSGASTNISFALVAAALLALSAAPAAAQNQGQGQGQGNAQPRCGLVIESTSDQWIINHDPLSDGQAARRFDLAVVNRGDGPCTGVVSVDLRGAPFGLAREGDTTRIPYTLVSEDGPVDITPRTGQNGRRPESRPFNLRPGDRELLSFSLAVNTTEMLAAGLYTQTAFIGIDHPNGSPLAERPITLGVKVASAALMGLKGEFTRMNGVATINLGTLVEGDRALNASLYVQSTSGYAVSVSSANAGRLRQGTTDWYIPYTLGIAGRMIDLTAPSRLDVVSTRPRFDDYPMSVRVGSVANRRAGDYSDVITFTIAAL